MIFPSKLETWGLPITEYKLFNKPIIAADLPYAHETIGDYKKVIFFKHENKEMLAKFMTNILEDNLIFSKRSIVKKNELYTDSYSNLFNILLNS